MISFSCPNCKATLKAPEEKTGSPSKCPYCHQQLRIPPPLQSTPEHSAQVEQLSANCPGCGRSSPFQLHELPLDLVCAQCKTNFLVASPPQGNGLTAIQDKAPSFPIVPSVHQLNHDRSEGTSEEPAKAKGIVPHLRAVAIGGGCIFLMLSFLGCSVGLTTWYFAFRSTPENLIVGEWARLTQTKDSPYWQIG
jgi:hypothetical protein